MFLSVSGPFNGGIAVTSVSNDSSQCRSCVLELSLEFCLLKANCEENLT